MPDALYEFSNTWFQDNAKPFWDQLVPVLEISTALEIGSYEGASACYLVDSVAARAPLTLHCIDTWGGGLEHQPDGSAPADMHAVEERFRRNITAAVERAEHPVDLQVHKGLSDDCLVRLLAGGGAGSCDFIYVDGSHQAPDVLG